MKEFFVAAAAVAALALPHAFAETVCQGSPLSGTVLDATQALVPGATVVLDGRQPVVSRADGEFEFACVTNGRHRLTASADGFAPLDEPVAVPHAGDVKLVLKLKLHKLIILYLNKKSRDHFPAFLLCRHLFLNYFLNERGIIFPDYL